MPRARSKAILFRIGTTGLCRGDERMSHDVDQWFADPTCGADWQDMDLVLADVELLPRLTRYLGEPSAPEFKKVDVVLALLELLEHDCRPEGGAEAERLAGEIRSTLRQHSAVAERAMPE